MKEKEDSNWDIPWDNYANEFDDSPAGCVISFPAFWLFLLGLAFVIMGSIYMEYSGLALGLTFIAVSIGLFVLKHRFDISYLKWTLQARNEEAEEIHNEILAEWNGRRYFLYLRPFETTGRLNVRGVGRGPIVEFEGLPKTIEFESLLTKALEFWGTLIGTGKPGEHLGAGRIPLADSSWQEEVRRLVRYADIVFIVPGRTRSSIWEFRYLFKTGYMRRAIVIMPPQVFGFDFKCLWSEARSALVRAGVKLPEYAPSGAFIQIAQNGRPKRVLKMPELLTESSLRDTLKELIP
ncbi:MAG TPA: hypothetical protein VH988_34940 [Thermoanaerobaculia bacterium]|nr:hypothetical protein [Thermoanaerobaculia bacterium]